MSNTTNMNSTGTEDKEKLRKDRSKQAVALAMQNRWGEAAAVNRSIVKEFPRDLEAYNRLGKALSELGRNREATEALEKALGISPHNGIARKNLDRLARLGDETSNAGARRCVTPDVFIEESGKTGVTSLINVASPEVLLKLAPGHAVAIQRDNGGLNVVEASGVFVGTVEPKLASRLVKLIKGGNTYEATVTSVGEQELTIIIREAFKHPSQRGIVSFPSRSGANYRVYVPTTLLGSDVSEEEADDTEPVAVKDWSDDDTEPGDDDAFTPVFHRIIKAGDEGVSDDGDI